MARRANGDPRLFGSEKVVHFELEGSFGRFELFDGSEEPLEALRRDEPLGSAQEEIVNAHQILRSASDPQATLK